MFSAIRPPLFSSWEMRLNLTQQQSRGSDETRQSPQIRDHNLEVKFGGTLIRVGAVRPHVQQLRFHCHARPIAASCQRSKSIRSAGPRDSRLTLKCHPLSTRPESWQPTCISTLVVFETGIPAHPVASYQSRTNQCTLLLFLTLSSTMAPLFDGLFPRPTYPQRSH